MKFYKQTVDSGIRPLEVVYQKVISTEFEKPVAYRSVLNINSVDLGVLSPAEYLPVAERTTQCVDLANRNIGTVIDDIIALEKKNIDFEWITVYIPVRMLLKTKLAANLSGMFAEKGCTSFNKLCLEFPIELLYDDRAAVNEALAPLRSLGVRIMLTGFGSEYCPTLRLNGLLVDTVMLDPYVASYFSVADSLGVPDSVIGFVRDCGCDAIADGVDVSENIETAYRYNCMGVVGKISGQNIRISTIIRG